MGLVSCACQTKCLRYVKRKQEGKKERKEEHIFDLVSTWKQAGSCEVINHRTVFYEWAILCGGARCTVHFIPLESNLSEQLHSESVTLNNYFFSSLFSSVTATIYVLYGERTECAGEGTHMKYIYMAGSDDICLYAFSLNICIPKKKGSVIHILTVY